MTNKKWSRAGSKDGYYWLDIRNIKNMAFDLVAKIVYIH